MSTINTICAMLQIDAHGSHSKRIRIIQGIVCDYYQIDISIMRSRIRTHRYVIPRHIAIFLSRELTKHSLEDIGKAFRPDMDHGTVLHACTTVTTRMQVDAVYAETVNTLRAKCAEAIEDLNMPLFALAKQPKA